MSRVIEFAQFRGVRLHVQPGQSAATVATLSRRVGDEPAVAGPLECGGATARSPSRAEPDPGPTCQESLQLVAAFRKIGTGSRRRAVMAFVEAVAEMS